MRFEIYASDTNTNYVDHTYIVNIFGILYFSEKSQDYMF